uniref:Uncharacterized protein n=1 Tax=Phocoena sinus TaxID=42100 RepID=A0A8C9BS60_PHOSS
LHHCSRSWGSVGLGEAPPPALWQLRASTPGSPAAHRFREALSDFQRTLAQLRGNAAIDYTQLGLRFKLQAWEVLFSVAAVQSQLGLWAEATHSLEEAISKGPEGARDDLDIALGQVQVRGR